MKNMTQPQWLKHIERTFSPSTRARGLALFHHSHVQSIAGGWEKDGRLVFDAGVIGSRGDRYETTLLFEKDDLTSECDCYVYLDCKHGAALAYAVAQDFERYLAVQQQTPLEQWLEKLRTAKSLQVSPPSGLKAQYWHLSYLLHLEGKSAYFEPRQRYLKKNGDWGQYRSVSPYQLLNDRTLEPLHQQIVTLLSSSTARFGFTEAHRFNGTSQWCIEGTSGHKLLTLALQSQRLMDAATLQPIAEGPPKDLSFEWQESADGSQLVATLHPAPEHPHWQLLAVSPPLYFAENTIGTARTSLNPDELDLLSSMPPVGKAHLPRVCANLSHLLGEHNLPSPGIDVMPTTLDRPSPKALLCGFEHSDQGTLPAVRLSMSYGPVDFPIRYGQAFMQQHEQSIGDLIELDDECVHVLRDYATEFQHAADLRRQGLVPGNHSDERGELWSPLSLNTQNYINEWHKLRPKLEQFFIDEKWQLEIDDTYHSPKAEAKISGQTSRYTAGWFDLDLSLEINGVCMNTSDLIARWLALDCPETLAVQNENRQWVLADMTVLKPIEALLGELYQDKPQNETLRLPHFKVAELAGLPDINYKQAPELQKLQKKLSDFKGLKGIKPSKALKATLRDYQQQGLNWLAFLHEYQFGGILADDMGLGKTVQALAFIQRLKAGRKLQHGALIVAPTSLLWNWQTEAAKFTPNLRCVILHGSARQPLFAALANYDLIITTYGLITRDIEHHKKHFYDVAVLDEAQKIKNKNAKTTRTVMQIPSAMRLCLTGTPLENHLGELWSIMNFAQPGLLGNYDYFRQTYRNAIEQDQDADRNRELSAKIAPFMVRRTKQAVAKELPAKSEIVQTVHLEKDQKALYESIRISRVIVKSGVQALN